MTAGHSTSPLADKLGLKPGMRAFVADMPDSVRQALALDDLGLTLLAAPSSGIDVAHIFVSDPETLDRELNALRQLLAPGGFVWVSWSQHGTAVTENTVREAALPIGLVPVEGCAIDDHWSGLKLMIAKELR